MRKIEIDDVDVVTGDNGLQLVLPGPSGQRRYALSVDTAYQLGNLLANRANRADASDWPDAIDIVGMKFTSRVTADGSVILMLTTSKGPIALRLSGDQLQGLASLPAADAQERPAQGSA